MNSEFKVLLIEDNPEDSYTIQRMISELGKGKVAFETTETINDGLDRLSKGGIDVILLDLSLPDSQGLESFSKLRAASIDLPVIVLTGLDDEDLAIQAISEGAQDYVCKNWMDGHMLWRSMRYRRF